MCSEKAHIMNQFEGRNLLLRWNTVMVNKDLNIKQWPLQGQQKRLINKVTV